MHTLSISAFSGYEWTICWTHHTSMQCPSRVSGRKTYGSQAAYHSLAYNLQR